MKPKLSYQEFLENLDPLQAEALSYLDKSFLSISGISRKMRYNVPFYDYNTWICYLNPIGKEMLELCFLEGKEMKNQFPELDMKGRKSVSGMSFPVDKDLPQALISQLINYAISLKMADS